MQRCMNKLQLIHFITLNYTVNKKPFCFSKKKEVLTYIMYNVIV